MKLRFIFIAAYTLLSSVLLGQESYTTSFGVRSDNDVYADPYQDQYYSNGLIFSYRFLPKSVPDHLFKKVFVIDFGQSIYMPSKDYKGLSGRPDRPYAGYLFANFSVEKYNRNRSLLKWGFQLGVVGPASKGEFVQEWMHRNFGFSENEGWDYQIQNQIGINLDFLYLRNIFYAFKKQFDMNVFMGGKAGTVFSQIDMGFVSRIGFNPLNAIHSTSLFHSNINRKETEIPNNEVFFFVRPLLSYLIYDATISGSLFNDRSPVSFPTLPIQTSLELGLKVTASRFDISYSVSFLSKRPDNNLVTPHKFGRLELVYRFI